MRTFLFGCLAAIKVMSAAAAPDPAGTCNRNIPVQWVIQTTYIDNLTMNALQSDGSAYINGQTGVTARINVCSGTNDATLSLSSPRYYTASFAKMLAKTPYTPSYAATGQTEQEPFINVRNVLYVPGGYNVADEYQFTTQLHCCSGLIMMNTRAQAATDTGPDSKVANDPYPNSLVDVYHCPANSTATTGLCAGVVHETWFVWPDPAATVPGTGYDGGPITQVATLTVTKGNTVSDAGEFSMPFYFVISSLQ